MIGALPSARTTLSVPGTAAGVRAGMDAFDAWALERRVPDRSRRRVLTALDELLSNVVRHGLDGTRGSIEIAFVADPGHLTVEIADDASPFNPLLVAPPDTAAPLDERREGGLGIALVRALADDLRYAREDGRNVVTLTWRIDT
jgi:anti-sigma regulatory factor (Ser/Thr protein kinase)